MVELGGSMRARGELVFPDEWSRSGSQVLLCGGRLEFQHMAVYAPTLSFRFLEGN